MPRNKEQNIWVKRLVTGDEIAYKKFFKKIIRLSFISHKDKPFFQSLLLLAF